MLKSTTVAPVSFQQEEMLGHMRKFPDCAARYDLIYLFRLDDVLDFEFLQESVADLVQRHSALRTVIASSDAGEPVQQVLSELPGDLVSDLGDWQSLEEVQKIIISRRHEPSAVESSLPMFRAFVFSVSGESYLSFIVHHLICDGWSAMILWRDLSELYSARVNERIPILAASGASYADFARGQVLAWDTIRTKALSFWSERSDGCASEICWPESGSFDVNSSSNEVEVHTFEVDVDTIGSVREFAVNSRVTIFMVLLGATALAISAATERRDLLFGSDTAARDSLDIHNTVGHFVNTAMVRVRIAPDADLYDVVRSIREFWLDAEEYRDAYSGKVLSAVGDPAILKVNMLDFPGQGDDLVFGQIHASPMVVDCKDPLRHDFGIFWRNEGNIYRLYVIRKKSLITSDVAERVGIDILESLTALA